MFDVKNIKKLFKYNWSDVFKTILPKGKSGKLTEEEQKTLQISSIIGIVASALVIISLVVLVYEIYVHSFGALSKYLKFSFFDVVSVGTIIWSIIKCAIIPIGVLVYNIVMGKKEQNGWVIFVMFVLVTLWVVYAFWEGLYGLRAIGYAPLAVLIGLAGSFATLLAGGNMVTVFIDYGARYNREENQPVNVNGGYAQPTNNGGYTQPTNNGGYAQPQETVQQQAYTQPQQAYTQPQETVQQPQQLAQKTCPQCGYTVQGDADFCSMCGYKF